MLVVTIYILMVFCTSKSVTLPKEDFTLAMDIGLEDHPDKLVERQRFQVALAENPSNATDYVLNFSLINSTVSFSVKKDVLKLGDSQDVQRIDCQVIYNISIPVVISYDLDSAQACVLLNVSWYWLPPSTAGNMSIPIFVKPKQIGISYLRVWVREAKRRDSDQPISQELSIMKNNRSNYFENFLNQTILESAEYFGFPVIVHRTNGPVQIAFRVMVVLMVTIFTFTMGCELDPATLKAHSRKPIGPAIGFCCQFTLMPLIAFSVAKVLPIKQEFRFGLLVVGCSPGGGASNVWSLLLGGDINLSVLMTFISSLAALFMMPLLLFLLGRFFIDVHLVKIPYLNISVQLLQIAIPALLGLGLRSWKPKIASRMTRLTRPLFIFFIIFFLTFGVYANWGILSLLGSYPIVIPTSALLPWIGFAMAGLTALAMCQPKPTVITVALETGIQNVGAAILVLLYSMPQPEGDLGAIMPISVSLLTPLPLNIIYLVLFIRRKCCRKGSLTLRQQNVEVDPDDLEQTRRLKGSDLDLAKEPVELPNSGSGDGAVCQNHK